MRKKQERLLEEAEFWEERGQKVEDTVPNKIIKMATGKHCPSVAGECMVENLKNKKHKQRALLLEWESKGAWNMTRRP